MVYFTITGVKKIVRYNEFRYISRGSTAFVF